MDELKIRFVVATRESRDGFFKSTAAGQFLQLYDFPFIELDLYPDNAEGLPLVYNQSIVKSKIGSRNSSVYSRRHLFIRFLLGG